MSAQQARAIAACDIQPGMTYLTHYGQRVVTEAGVERDGGAEWFVWRWKREPRSDGIDCGYGGVRLDGAKSEIVRVLT